jgi:hypothetical protein
MEHTYCKKSPLVGLITMEHGYWTARTNGYGILQHDIYNCNITYSQKKLLNGFKVNSTALVIFDCQRQTKPTL